MVKVRKAVEADFDQVYELLRQSPLNSRDLPRENRKRMFQQHWSSAEDYYGYVLEDDSAIVGYMGLMFSRRDVRGELRKFCEVHSWYVKEEFRNESLKLFFPIIGLKGYEITNLTPTQGVAEIQKKFGFKDLETHLRIVYPVPTWSTLWTPYKQVIDLSAIESRLSGPDLRTFRDHRHLRCVHMVFEHKGKRCYIIAKRLRRKWWEPYVRIFYISDLNVFEELLPALRVRLCLRLGGRCLVINNEMLEGVDVRFSRIMKREVPSIYKSSSLARRDIDHLYSAPLVLDYHLQ